jgi:hypothetical protein
VLKDFPFPLLHRFFHRSAFLNLHLCVLVYLSVRAPACHQLCLVVHQHSHPTGRQHHYKRWPPKSLSLYTEWSIHVALLPFSVNEICRVVCLQEGSSLPCFYVLQTQVLATAPARTYVMYGFLQYYNFFFYVLYGLFVLYFFQFQVGTTIVSVWFGLIHFHIDGRIPKQLLKVIIHFTYFSM